MLNSSQHSTYIYLPNKLLLNDEQSLLQSPRQAEFIDEKSNVRVDQLQCKAGDTVRRTMSKPRGSPTEKKIDLIIDLSRRIISEIKLKRTDTTLDLSQKAKRAKEEKKKLEGEEGVYIGEPRRL